MNGEGEDFVGRRIIALLYAVLMALAILLLFRFIIPSDASADTEQGPAAIISLPDALYRDSQATYDNSAVFRAQAQGEGIKAPVIETFAISGDGHVVGECPLSGIPLCRQRASR